MVFLISGYFQDGLKVIIYLIPLIYLIAKKNELKLRYSWLLLVGLFLLFFGQVLDFLDEFEYLRRIFTSEGAHFLQDFFEDMVGFTLGFVIFILGIYLEFKYMKKK